MKFWEKIFLYSLILFFLLFSGGGIILIEKIHSESLDTAIKSIMYKYLNVESVMYLNSDYLMDIDVNSESNMKNWVDIIINGYSVNNVEQYNTELYSMEKIHNSKINLSEIELILQNLKRMTLNDKKSLKGLQPKRADIITAGVEILHTIMKNLEIKEITVSEYDNLEGLMCQNIKNMS